MQKLCLNFIFMLNKYFTNVADIYLYGENQRVSSFDPVKIQELALHTTSMHTD